MSAPPPPAAPPPPVPRLPTAPWLGLAVAMAVLLVYTVPVAARRNADFVHLWLGGHALARAGAGGLYDPSVQLRLLQDAFGGAVPDDLWAERNTLVGAFFYPPPAALAYLPLGWLPLATAARIAPLLNLGAVAGAAALLARLTGARRLVALAGALWLPAVLHSHVLGQNGGLALLVLAGGALALHRGRALLGGALLGLLAAKPSWWLAVAWLPLALGAGRAVAGFAGGTAAVVLGSAVLVGVPAWVDWLALAPRIARLDTLPGYPLSLQYSLPGLGRRLMSGPGGPWLGRGLALAALALGARQTRRLWPRDRARALCLALATAMLASPHAHAYDLVGALPGLLLLGARRGGVPAVVVLVLLHHGGQALEGGAGTGWALPPATVGLIAVWAALLGWPGAAEPPVAGPYSPSPAPSRS